MIGGVRRSDRHPIHPSTVHTHAHTHTLLHLVNGQGCWPFLGLGATAAAVFHFLPM